MEQLFKPNLLGATPEENIRILHDYLYQLTDQLEFILDNIGADNLSAPLLNKLNSLGADIEASQTVNSQTQAQIGGLELLTVSDVINSAAFASAINAAKPVGGDGYVSFPDGILICYGKSAGTFARTFASAPALITRPSCEARVSATEFETIDVQGDVDYIAIGREV